MRGEEPSWHTDKKDAGIGDEGTDDDEGSSDDDVVADIVVGETTSQIWGSWQLSLRTLQLWLRLQMAMEPCWHNCSEIGVVGAWNGRDDDMVDGGGGNLPYRPEAVSHH